MQTPDFLKDINLLHEIDGRLIKHLHRVAALAREGKEEFSKLESQYNSERGWNKPRFARSITVARAELTTFKEYSEELEEACKKHLEKFIEKQSVERLLLKSVAQAHRVAKIHMTENFGVWLRHDWLEEWLKRVMRYIERRQTKAAGIYGVVSLYRSPNPGIDGPFTFLVQGAKYLTEWVEELTKIITIILTKDYPQEESLEREAEQGMKGGEVLAVVKALQFPNLFYAVDRNGNCYLGRYVNLREERAAIGIKFWESIPKQLMLLYDDANNPRLKPVGTASATLRLPLKKIFLIKKLR